MQTIYMLLAAALLIGAAIGATILKNLFLQQPRGVKLGIVGGLTILASAWSSGFTEAFGLHFVFWALGLALAWAFLETRGGGAGAGDEDHVRGNSLVDVKVVQKMVKGEEANIALGEVSIPKKFETSHFLLTGTTGAGKSQSIHQILRPVRVKGERAIVADVGGEFLARYIKPGDIVFNPFDKRGVSWSPLAEMRGPYDAERIAKSFVPDGTGSSVEWNQYAQTLLAAILYQQYESGQGTNGEILRLATRAAPAELKAIVAGQPAEGLFAKEDSAMLASIMGILASKVKPLQYLDPAAGENSFSIRSWMQQESDSWLFLSFTDSQFVALKPLIAAALDISISALLDLKPNFDRRVWFVIDEVATYGYINSLEALLTKGKKYGGCAVLGLQAISQLRDSYGQQIAQTLLACLGSWLVLRCPDGETAEYMSRHVGDEEIRRVNESTSQNGMQVSRSQSVEYKTQRVILPSEIAQLPNLVGILNIVGAIPPCVVAVPIDKEPEVAERFEEKPRVPRVVVAAQKEEDQPAQLTESAPAHSVEPTPF